MNLKSFIIGSIVGAIVSFVSGWIFYGLLFTNIYPETVNMLFISLGSLFYSMLITYVFLQWANISTYKTGARAGAVLGLFTGFMFNFYYFADKTPNYGNLALDVVITIIYSAMMGAAIGFVLGKLKSS